MSIQQKFALVVMVTAVVTFGICTLALASI